MNQKKEIHAWINALKARKRYSFGYLGELIGYSDVGFSKALRNENLSVDQVKIIADKLDLLDEFNTLIGSKFSGSISVEILDLSKASDESLEIEVLRRWRDFRERPMIKTVLESEREVALSKRLLQLQEKGKLKEYLNS